MRRWLKYPLLVLAGLLLGLGAHLVEQTLTQTAHEGRCRDAVLERYGWGEAARDAQALDALRAQAARDDPAFAAQFLFNTSEEVAAAYGAYATCVATDPS